MNLPIVITLLIISGISFGSGTTTNAQEKEPNSPIRNVVNFSDGTKIETIRHFDLLHQIVDEKRGVVCYAITPMVSSSGGSSLFCVKTN